MSAFPAPSSPMWLAHHDVDHLDRCVVLGGHHVCRRCVVLYPGMLVVAALQLAGVIPGGVGIAFIWLTPLPVVAEWIAEHVGGLAYSRRRQVATTALASVSFGVALGRHVRHPFELAATAPAITFTVVCLVSWYVGARRHDAELVDWETEFEAAEDDRLDTLLAVLEERGIGDDLRDEPAPVSRLRTRSR